MKKSKKVSEEVSSNEEDITGIINKLTTETDAESLLRLNGVYYISGEIESGGLKDICLDILVKQQLWPKIWKWPLQIIINSPGGVVDEANALIDIMGNVAMEVRTTVLGNASSAAAMIAAAGTKGMRVISPNATMMVHRYTWGIYDKHAEIVAQRGIEDSTHESQVRFWIEHSKYNNKAAVEEHLLKTTNCWMTAKEAIKHGIVDSISAKFR